MQKIANSVVQGVTAKKKYVKPDFEVIELNWEAPLLMGSGGTTNPAGQAGWGGGISGTSSWGSNN